MNQRMTNNVKHLAKPCYEAIKVIVGERRCGECKGRGWFKAITTYPSGKEDCPTCNGTGKRKYVWEPKVGEFFLYPITPLMPYVKEKQTAIFVCTAVTAESQGQECYLEYSFGGRLWKANKQDCTPILPWETIEEILEGVGYRVSTRKHIGNIMEPVGYVECCIREFCSDVPLDPLVKCRGKSRQQAVMLAVIALGKEIKNA